MMHNTKVTTKDGKEFNGYMWLWRPEENYFVLRGNIREKTFTFSECESVITENERININKIGDCDEIERAREHLKDGREFGWIGTPEKKWDWE